MTIYKIQAKSVTGTVLIFTVPKYNIEDDFIVFYDEKTNTTKKFHSSNCEITEVKQ